ncbi:MAG TPA: DeoR/GlpR family DNA-binding transcription regulator [Devosia sp.]|nr:DeoR/GlpR family DNA-binding transcription regulator [Devosia sp.]
MSERHQKILELARLRDRVTVDDLAAHFAVSAQTIRKDLNALGDQQLLARVHGGAELPSGIENVQYEARRLIAAAQKDAIGRAAAALIPNDASVFINIGTTTEAVSQALLKHAGLLVVTNNINVANRMRIYPQFEVVIAGGIVRGSDCGIVGAAEAAFFSQFKVDYAVIGASALDQDGALLDYDYREVKVAQAIIANARHVILVADASKFARTAPVRIARIDQIGTFITDHCPTGFAALCHAAGVALVETKASETT